MDSSIALSSDLVILEAETAGERLMRNSKTMEKILKVAQKEHLTVKEVTRRREGSAQCDTRKKGGWAPQIWEERAFRTRG